MPQWRRRWDFAYCSLKILPVSTFCTMGKMMVLATLCINRLRNGQSSQLFHGGAIDPFQVLHGFQNRLR